MEYKDFFKQKMEEHGIDGIGDLSDDAKSKFFKEVKKDWTKQKDAAVGPATWLRAVLKDPALKLAVNDLIGVLYNVTAYDAALKRTAKLAINTLILDLKSLDPLNKKSKRKASGDYKEFYKKKLEDMGAKDLGDLSDTEKRRFFNEIKTEWKKDKKAALSHYC